MSGFARGATMALLLLYPLNATAWGWQRHPAATSAYYYPAAYSYAPTYAEPPTNPMPLYGSPMPCVPALQPGAPAAPAYATPTPAPPSATTATPSPSAAAPSKPAPAVSESRSYFDAYGVAPRASDKPPSGVRCQVHFWNLSDHELTIKVNDQIRTLPQGKRTDLELNREFVWRVDERDPQTEHVAADQSALTIVIRR